MNIKDLTFFLYICKDKSIRKAAKSLYITPQGLSKSIKNLEDKLQFQLFYRTTNGIVLTEYGEIVKNHAEHILNDVQCMNTELINLANLNHGEVLIACAYGITSVLSPEHLLKYRKDNPDVNLNIVEYPDLLVEKAILEEKAILGFTIGPVDKKKFDAILIQAHKLYLLVNVKNPLSKKGKISFEDLKNEKFILVNKYFKTHHNIVKKCESAGFSPDISFDISEISIAHKFCHLNYGVSVTVDYVMQDIQFDDVSALPFEDDTCTWEIYMITKKEAYLSHTTKNFMNHVIRWFVEEQKVISAIYNVLIELDKKSQS